MSEIQKLIIIRGPSGAGKSSVTKELLAKTSRPTLLVSVDTIRMLFSDQKKPDHQTSKRLVINNVIFGLESGYDVILEGILNIKTDKFMFDKIFAVHPEGNYLFYLNVSYQETLRRHRNRPEKDLFGEEEMKEWWGWSLPSNHASETIIPENSSLEETVTKIMEISGVK